MLDIPWELWGMYLVLLLGSLAFLALCAYLIRRYKRENEKRTAELLRTLFIGIFAGIVAAAWISLSDNIGLDTSSLMGFIASIMISLFTISGFMVMIMMAFGALWYMYPKEKRKKRRKSK